MLVGLNYFYGPFTCKGLFWKAIEWCYNHNATYIMAKFCKLTKILLGSHRDQITRIFYKLNQCPMDHVFVCRVVYPILLRSHVDARMRREGKSCIHILLWPMIIHTLAWESPGTPHSWRCHTKSTYGFFSYFSLVRTRSKTNLTQGNCIVHALEALSHSVPHLLEPIGARKFVRLCTELEPSVRRAMSGGTSSTWT